MSSLKISIHDQPALVPDSFQGMSVFQVEFRANVPWVLQESEPE
jgi:hypothetical protein